MVKFISPDGNLLAIVEDALYRLEGAIVNESWNELALKTIYQQNSLTPKTAGKQCVKIEVYFRVKYRESYVE